MEKQVLIRVLGPIDVERDGVAVELRSDRQRAILAILAASAGRVVAEDVLIDGVWGERLPDAPSGALRTHITRLRHLIGDPARINHRSGGYALDVRSDGLDSARFEATLPCVDMPPSVRADTLAAALALWRGRAFAEFCDLPCVQAEAVRLDTLHLRAAEDYGEALLDSGQLQAAAPVLESLVADEPLRERARALLMRSLYEEGRAVEALATYREFRVLLGDELGLVPSPALAELESAILTHRLDTPKVVSAATPHDSALPPLPITELVGRSDALAEVEERLSVARVLTITGPGGVGKTRLALHTSHRVRSHYPDGVWWCDLTSAVDGEVATTVASVLGVDERAGFTVEQRIVDVLAARRALVVLDNCEHVLDDVVTLVDPLVRAAREVDVLVTSREVLALDGEHRYRLDPLPIPVGDEVTDSVDLFLRRVRATAPTAVAEESAWDSALQICRALDGLPLALELAAARVSQMTIADVSRQLDDRFALLASTGRSSDQRHHGLAETLAWSYQLLTTPESRLLDALSTFAGPFTMDDARRLVDADAPEGEAPGSVTQLLGGLVDKSLIERATHRGSVRYRLLESVRAYGADRLEATGLDETWRRRHCDFVLDLVARTESELIGPGEVAHQHVFDEHVGDLRTAHAWLIEHGDVDGQLRLCAGLRWFADLRNRPEPIRWASDLVAGEALTGEKSQHALTPAVVAMAGVGAIKRGDLDAGAALAERAERGSRHPSGYGGEILARVALFHGDLDLAVARSREAQGRFRADGNNFSAVMAATPEVLGLRFAGHQAAAEEALRRLLAEAESIGCPSQLAFCEYCAAEVRIDVHDQARTHLLRARQLALSSGAEFVLGLTLTTLAGIDVHHHANEAREHLRSALDHWERAGSWKQQWWLTLRILIEWLSERTRHGDVATLAAAFVASPTTGPVYGDDADRLAAALTRARIHLGEHEFAARSADGAALDDVAALAYGRAAIDHVG